MNAFSSFYFFVIHILDIYTLPFLKANNNKKLLNKVSTKNTVNFRVSIVTLWTGFSVGIRVQNMLNIHMYDIPTICREQSNIGHIPLGGASTSSSTCLVSLLANPSSMACVCC